MDTDHEYRLKCLEMAQEAETLWDKETESAVPKTDAVLIRATAYADFIKKGH